jgi:hypothetical protein
MDLFQALNNVNYDKKNLIRDSDAPDVAEKLYPKFPVSRSLSYSMDAILLVNELNTRGLAQHDITNKQHFEFLLHVLPKKKRYGKWEKPEVSEETQLLIDCYNYSYEKAKEAAAVLTTEQLDEIKRSLSKGGADNARVKKRSS